MGAATKYGVSYWDARTPRAKRPSSPRHRGHLETEVAIIGGGLGGCAAAYVFAASGISVALFEEGRLAGGATGASSGLLFQSPDSSFGELAGLHGVKTARHIYQATRRASLDLAATLRRLGVRSTLAVGPSLKLARSDDEARRLRRELTARRDAGLDGVWVNARRLQSDAGLEASGAILAKEDALVDPVRTALGLARAAAARGARLFERSAVARVKPARKWIELKTDGGTVRAAVAVVATGGPPDGFDSLERHFKRFHTYHVVTEPLPAAVRKETGRLHAIVRDSHSPPHQLGWLPDGRVLFAGADQPALADRARPRAITQRTGELMYELSRLYPAISGLLPSFGWDAACPRTADGIAFIGPHRNYPRHLFALGSPPGGLAQAFLAARVLLRAHTGTPDASDHAFAFTRLIA